MAASFSRSLSFSFLSPPSLIDDAQTKAMLKKLSMADQGVLFEDQLLQVLSLTPPPPSPPHCPPPPLPLLVSRRSLFIFLAFLFL